MSPFVDMNGSRTRKIILFSVITLSFIGLGAYIAFRQGYFPESFYDARAYRFVKKFNDAERKAGNAPVGVTPSPLPAPLATFDTSLFLGMLVDGEMNTSGFVTSDALIPPPKTVDEGIVACDTYKPKIVYEVSKNACFEGLALGFRAPGVCERMSSQAEELATSSFESDVEQCYSLFSQVYKPFDCTGVIRQPYRDICFHEYAADDVSPTLDCSKIQDQQIKKKCEEDVEWRKLSPIDSVTE